MKFKTGDRIFRPNVDGKKITGGGLVKYAGPITQYPTEMSYSILWDHFGFAVGYGPDQIDPSYEIDTEWVFYPDQTIVITDHDHVWHIQLSSIAHRRAHNSPEYSIEYGRVMTDPQMGIDWARTAMVWGDMNAKLVHTPPKITAPSPDSWVFSLLSE